MLAFFRFARVLLRQCAVPTSDAAVERRFIAVTLELTALRNRLLASTLKELLRMGGVKEEGLGDGEKMEDSGSVL